LFTPVGDVCEPDAACAELYQNLLPRIQELEKSEPVS